MKAGDRNRAREALAAIIHASKLQALPEKPSAYRKACLQLMDDYKEVREMLECLFPKDERVDARTAFDQALGYVKVNYLRTSPQPDVNPETPYEFRPERESQIRNELRNLPQNFALMVPLYGKRFAMLVNERTARVGSYTHSYP